MTIAIHSFLHLDRVRPPRRCFTLVELLVSITLVVLLLLGVNQVFKLSGDAVGAGNKVSEMTRENRGAQAIMQEDFRGVMPDTPIFMIWSQLVRLNSGEIRRFSHMRFFRTGVHYRHTANDGAFTSSTQALDAYIAYGAVVPDDAILDPNDPLATLRVITRNAILLKDAQYFGTGPNAENHYQAKGSGLSIQWDTPLAYDSAAAQPTANARSGNVLETSISSRLDIAKETVDDFRAEVFDRRLAVTSTNGIPDYLVRDGNWWHRLFGPTRNQIEPFRVLLKPGKPLDSEGVAKSAPLFVPNISNFIIEFAGDYVTQNNNRNHAAYGAVIANEPDQITDFMTDPPYDPGPIPLPPAIVTRKTRWYGLPRDIDGDGQINWRFDVVPVREVLRGGLEAPTGTTGAGGQRDGEIVFVAPFERQMPNGRARQSPGGAGGTYQLSSVTDPYVCLWVDGGNQGTKPYRTPRMLRILIKIEDPTGRLPDGQWWEYIVNP